jgi:hypothetical protein
MRVSSGVATEQPHKPAEHHDTGITKVLSERKGPRKIKTLFNLTGRYEVYPPKKAW